MARCVNHRWTEDEKQTLTRLFDEGKTTREIAECIGLSPARVGAACGRLGLNRMGVSPHEYAARRKEQAASCRSTVQSRNRMRDYMREYMWEYRARKAPSNPGVTP